MHTEVSHLMPITVRSSLVCPGLSPRAYGPLGEMIVENVSEDEYQEEVEASLLLGAEMIKSALSPTDEGR